MFKFFVNTNLKRILNYSFSGIIIAIIPLITLPIYTRRITPEEYGYYAVSIAFGTLISGISALGLINLFERNFFQTRNPEKQKHLFTSYLSLYCSIFILIITLLIIIDNFGSGKFLDFVPIIYKPLLLGMSVASFLANIKTMLLMYLKNTDNNFLHARYTSIEPALYAVFSLTLLFLTELGIYSLMMGQILSVTIITISGILKLRLLKKIKFSRILFHLRDLKTSIGLLPRIFTGILSNQIDKFILNGVLSSANLGIYSVGQKIGNINFVLITSYYNISSSRIYESLFKNKKQEIKKLLITPFVLSAFTTLSIVTFSDLLIRFFLPEEFHSASNFVNLFALLNFSFFFTKVPQLLYAERTWVISILSYIGVLMNASSCYLLSIKYGALGAAYGLLISGVLLTLITFAVSQKVYRINYPNRLILVAIVIIFLQFFFIYITNLKVISILIWLLSLLFAVRIIKKTENNSFE